MVPLNRMLLFATVCLNFGLLDSLPIANETQREVLRKLYHKLRVDVEGFGIALNFTDDIRTDNQDSDPNEGASKWSFSSIVDTVMGRERDQGHQQKMESVKEQQEPVKNGVSDTINDIITNLNVVRDIVVGRNCSGSESLKSEEREDKGSNLEANNYLRGQKESDTSAEHTSSEQGATQSDNLSKEKSKESSEEDSSAVNLATSTTEKSQSVSSEDGVSKITHSESENSSEDANKSSNADKSSEETDKSSDEKSGILIAKEESSETTEAAATNPNTADSKSSEDNSEDDSENSHAVTTSTASPTPKSIKGFRAHLELLKGRQPTTPKEPEEEAETITESATTAIYDFVGKVASSLGFGADSKEKSDEQLEVQIEENAGDVHGETDNKEDEEDKNSNTEANNSAESGSTEKSSTEQKSQENKSEDKSDSEGPKNVFIDYNSFFQSLQNAIEATTVTDDTDETTAASEMPEMEEMRENDGKESSAEDNKSQPTDETTDNILIVTSLEQEVVIIPKDSSEDNTETEATNYETSSGEKLQPKFKDAVNALNNIRKVIFGASDSSKESANYAPAQKGSGEGDENVSGTTAINQLEADESDSHPEKMDGTDTTAAAAAGIDNENVPVNASGENEDVPPPTTHSSIESETGSSENEIEATEVIGINEISTQSESERDGADDDENKGSSEGTTIVSSVGGKSAETSSEQSGVDSNVPKTDATSGEKSQESGEKKESDDEIIPTADIITETNFATSATTELNSSKDESEEGGDSQEEVTVSPVLEEAISASESNLSKEKSSEDDSSEKTETPLNESAEESPTELEKDEDKHSQEKSDSENLHSTDENISSETESNLGSEVTTEGSIFVNLNTNSETSDSDKSTDAESKEETAPGEQTLNIVKTVASAENENNSNAEKDKTTENDSNKSNEESDNIPSTVATGENTDAPEDSAEKSTEAKEIGKLAEIEEEDDAAEKESIPTTAQTYENTEAPLDSNETESKEIKILTSGADGEAENKQSSKESSAEVAKDIINENEQPSDLENDYEEPLIEARPTDLASSEDTNNASAAPETENESDKKSDEIFIPVAGFGGEDSQIAPDESENDNDDGENSQENPQPTVPLPEIEKDYGEQSGEHPQPTQSVPEKPSSQEDNGSKEDKNDDLILIASTPGEKEDANERGEKEIIVTGTVHTHKKSSQEEEVNILSTSGENNKEELEIETKSSESSPAPDIDASSEKLGGVEISLPKLTSVEEKANSGESSKEKEGILDTVIGGIGSAFEKAKNAFEDSSEKTITEAEKSDDKSDEDKGLFGGIVSGATSVFGKIKEQFEDGKDSKESESKPSDDENSQEARGILAKTEEEARKISEFFTRDKDGETTNEEGAAIIVDPSLGETSAEKATDTTNTEGSKTENSKEDDSFFGSSIIKSTGSAINKITSLFDGDKEDPKSEEKQTESEEGVYGSVIHAIDEKMNTTGIRTSLHEAEKVLKEIIGKLPDSSDESSEIKTDDVAEANKESENEDQEKNANSAEVVAVTDTKSSAENAAEKENSDEETGVAANLPISSAEAKTSAEKGAESGESEKESLLIPHTVTNNNGNNLDNNGHTDLSGGGIRNSADSNEGRDKTREHVVSGGADYDYEIKLEAPGERGGASEENKSPAETEEWGGAGTGGAPDNQGQPDNSAENETDDIKYEHNLGSNLISPGTENVEPSMLSMKQFHDNKGNPEPRVNVTFNAPKDKGVYDMYIDRKGRRCSDFTELPLDVEYLREVFVNLGYSNFQLPSLGVNLNELADKAVFFKDLDDNSILCGTLTINHR